MRCAWAAVVVQLVKSECCRERVLPTALSVSARCIAVVVIVDQCGVRLGLAW